MAHMLHWIRLRHHWILSIIAIFVIITNYSLYRNLNDLSSTAANCDFHRRWTFENNEYVKKVLRMKPPAYSGYYKDLMDDSYPNVLDIGQETCASLAPFGPGGEPVYCFDRKTKKTTRFYPGGE